MEKLYRESLSSGKGIRLADKDKRHTVMVRVEVDLRDRLKREALRTKETISKIIDWGMREYLESVRKLD